MKYSQETKELVRLAKKTNNMPTLMYTIHMLTIFYNNNDYMQAVNKNKKFTTQDVIQAFYKTVATADFSSLSYSSEKEVEENFILIMNNWKQFKKSNPNPYKFT